jgi:hypothetical protein
MIWGNPVAVWALLALAAPIVVHLLVRRQARPIPFPTLRFIPRASFASVERRIFEDAALLAVRIGVIAAAAAAIAAPFVMTAARQRAWDAATIRAEVASGVPARGDSDRTFSSATVASGITQALAWFDSQPPGRRQLIVRSTFPLGSIDDADVARIPRNIGVRLERSGTLPGARTFPAAPIISGRIGSTVRAEREVRFEGGRTSVRTLAGTTSASLPIEISAPESRRASADDVLRAVVADGVSVPIGSRTARIELADATVSDSAPAIGEIRRPWMADAIDRIWRESSLRPSLLKNARFDAAGDRFVIHVAARIPESDLADLIRLVLDAMGPPGEHPNEEILPIPDAKLQAWSREAGPASPPAIDQRPDDGRWFWLLSLVLLAVESAVRSSLERRHARATEPIPSERARVA